MSSPRIAFQPSPGVKFGCRQIAFMTEGGEPTPAQRAMLVELLKDNPNSLKEQSKKRDHPHRDGIASPKHEEDLLRDPQDGCLDGWGFASYTAGNADSVEIRKSLQPAATDPQFDAVAEELVGKSPRTLLAHVMNKIFSTRTLATEEDTHPFTFANWSSMFNGVLNGGRTPGIMNALQTTWYPVLGTLPKGTNSGEKILLYFLGKLKQKYNTTNSQDIPTPKLQQAFAETMRDFMQASTPIYDTLEGNISGLKGKIQWGPSCNYVMTDGKVVMAYRKGRKLYLNRHVRENGKSGYLVASEPMQPKGQNLEWLELPQEHILTLAKNTGGDIEASLIPVSSALEATP